jgi:hypothetical protein
MTQLQIQSVLSDLNTQFSDGITTLYSEDIWMKMDEVSEIMLISNENIYPDNGLEVFFDSANELVKVVEGYVDGETFVNIGTGFFISYDQIMGFMLAKANSTKSPYKRSSSI